MRSVPTTQRWPTTYSTGGLVCSVDHLASSAGAQILADAGPAFAVILQRTMRVARDAIVPDWLR